MGQAADDAAVRDSGMLRLENLDTDLRPPDVALAASKSAIDDDAANSWLPFVGQTELRAAVARHVARLSGAAYDPGSEVLVTAGGLNGCLMTLLAILEPGDEVVVTDPTYAGIINRILVAGGRPVFVPFRWEGGAWRLERAALEAAVTARTKAMLLMSPSMPSGALLDRADWEAVARLCLERGLWLLYDAAMERILYDGKTGLHPAGLPGMADRTITIGSASKELRMIGWRVGWVVARAGILRDIALAELCDVTTPVGIAQPGVAAALSAPNADADLAAAVAEWQARRDVLQQELAGLPVRGAAGGWSLLLDVAERGLEAAEASRRLFERGKIAATPMTHWGPRVAPRHVRFVFSNEPVERLRGVGARVREALGWS
jgi:aspartate/methionine/tyrosine aminotransferase